MSSQKMAAIRVVPWFDSDEWKRVFQQIYTESVDQIKEREVALEYMKMWQRKTDNLAAGVQATIEVLEAMLTGEDVDIRTQRVVFSMALMKFVNLMVDGSDNRTGSLFLNAQKLNIPDWMVDLRHTIAHGKDLPSIPVLRLGLDSALQWLYKEYWFPESELITDYVIDEVETSEEHLRIYEELLTDLFLLYNKIITVIHSSGRYICLNKVQNVALKKYIWKESNRLLTEQVTLITKESSLREIRNCVVHNIGEVVTNNNNISSRYEVLIDVMLDKSLFFNYAVLKQKINNFKSYVNVWNSFICYLDSVNALSILMKRLMVINCDENATKKKRIIAGRWIEYISRGIIRCQRVKKLLDANLANRQYRIEDALRDVVNLKPELGTSIFLNYRTEIDPFFTESKAIRYFMTRTNGIPLGKYWLFVLLLTEQQFDPESVKQLVKMQELMENNGEGSADGDNDVEGPERIYTIEDVNKIKAAINKNDDCNFPSNGIWSEAPDHYDWGSYPIGRLPWQ